MYNWFNTHLHLHQPVPVKEHSFVPIPPRELSVFDAAHPRPKDEVGAEGVKRVMTEQAKEQMQSLEPRDAKRLAEFRKVVGAALRDMVGDALPSAESNATTELGVDRKEKIAVHRLLLKRKGQADGVPAIAIVPDGATADDVVIWVHPGGKASLFETGERLVPAAQAILDRKCAILAIDVFGCGEKPIAKPAVNTTYAGYSFGYNRPLLGERVRDILTAVMVTRESHKGKIQVVGWESAGPWVVLAKALAGDAVSRCAADLDGFRFDSVRAIDDPMMLPGALKYGGMAAFAALCAPGDLLLHNHRGTGTEQLVPLAFKAAGAEQRLRRSAEKMPADKVVDWLLSVP
jgi:hypothetical protein